MSEKISLDSSEYLVIITAIMGDKTIAIIFIIFCISIFYLF